MKKLTIYGLLLLCLVLGSCKKFLDEYSQDEIKPTTTTDLISLMYSDAYPYQTPTENFDLLTDDIQCNGLSKTTAGDQVSTYVTPLQNGTAMFKFDPTMFDVTSTIPSGADVYTTYYSKIKGCNVVMDQLPNVSGSDQDKNAIMGQCLFLRAFYYLKLVTIYAQPYNGSGVDASTSLGVPLVISSQVRDGSLTRNTLKEVYDQIETDLLKALDLLKANYTPTTTFRVGSTAAYCLLSRFYVYRGLDTDWDKAINYATLGLQQNSNLTSFNTFVSATNAIVNTGIYSSTNPETIWVYGSNPNSDVRYFPTVTSTYIPPYTVSASLSTLYTQNSTTSNYGDLRYRVYFNSFTGIGPYTTAKSVTNATYGSKGLRVAELYLNRAEAYARRLAKNGAAADGVQALADLNTLRATRFDTRSAAYTPVAITDATALFKFYQDERRRELCLEDGHRWVDIKRFGLAVTHVYTGADGLTATFTLAAGSKLYALPIPYTAINNNPGLVQNPR
ncbi:RagB/SusD family nutrient uptake outer membrane protein [Mucilaginibacter paludis]|uniref:RagB/SusD domain-containing protein n=1 Tax=Mucilaginibacter paludis DSM 18603 TaxID=714943 RepID=H1Y336_9SPHI|nr:RagB/SusD family nutrient uptake outer membrane protein [Mucilaginibacter paludis]EHQ28854.1 RagB/SusD domain-containing protein [Mucilaginibacter paludis DSM 18603]